MSVREEYMKKLIGIDEAVKLIRSGDKIVTPLAVGEAVGLMQAISRRRGEVENVELIAQGPLGSYDYLSPGMEESFRQNSFFFLEPTGRRAYLDGRAEFTPGHGGSIPGIIADWMIKGLPKESVKVIADVSPMDKYGYFSFGTSPSYVLEIARLPNVTTILEVNENQPRIYGDNFMHISEVDYIVENNHPLKEVPAPEPTPEDKAIAEFIAEEIEDGATIQLGIGGMPNVLGTLLLNKHDLGAHTEMIGDAFVVLWEAGVLTGVRKTLHPRKIVATFIMASKAVYDWANENPAIEMYPQSYTNDPCVIGRNVKMVSINQAIQIDFQGQAASESIGLRQYSGVGGQLNFVQGAQYSPGGKSFICLRSTAKTSEGVVSTIVPMLHEGAAVTTPRTDVQYVVTEYGIAQLKGKSIRQRCKELIAIAHPDFREHLKSEAKRLGII